MKKIYPRVFGLLLAGLVVLIGVVGAPVAADTSLFTVRVQYDDGRAISGATVEVLAAGSGSVVASGGTGSDGRVSFTLDNGTYKLRVISGSLCFSSDEWGPKYIYTLPTDTSATVTFSVTWVEGELPTNQPPALDVIGDKVVNEGELLTFTILATDPYGDPLTYSASNLPSGATFEPATRVFSWTPGYNQAGTYPNVHFAVSDGSLTDSEDITITVNNVVLQANVDVDPDTLNLKSKGQWITAYIELPPGNHPGQIDITTVRLNGLVPAVTDPKYDFVTDPSVYITDIDGDGVLERMVKFDRNAVQNLLAVGDNVVTISGCLLGWPDKPDFAGSATIKVK